MLNKLVRIADQLDAEGKHELAEVVDNVIKSFAARHKGKVKKMDEDIKKDLMKFVHNVKKNLKQSSESLEEFFRRLRYFGIDDTVKEFGLDKSLKEIAKLLDTIDGANVKFYEVAFGKKPSKDDLENLAKALDGKLEEQKAEDPLSFFGQHSNQMDESIFGRDEKGERFPKALESIKCEDCGKQMPLKVMESGAGYYLGRSCSCGPFSRESKYFKTEESAQEYLDSLDKPAEIEVTQKAEDEELKEFWKEEK